MSVDFWFEALRKVRLHVVISDACDTIASMTPWWKKLMSTRRDRGTTHGVAELPRLNRAAIAHLLVTRYKLPQVDWDIADEWLTKHHSQSIELMRRAVVAAWLEELRDALDVDHQSWRMLQVEGLTPLESSFGLRTKKALDRSITEVQRSLEPVRGGATIPAFALVGLRTQSDYISFESHFFSGEGQWATSGGCYIRARGPSFPLIVLNLSSKFHAEATIAHELTHHALCECNIPLWIEEGLTQMMEERVTGIQNFSLSAETAGKQRARWAGDALREFLDGEGFSSPEDEDQQLAYHLSQWIVRRLLDEQPKQFFAFLRDCADTEPNASCLKHLGCSEEELARSAAGIPDEE